MSGRQIPKASAASPDTGTPLLQGIGDAGTLASSVVDGRLVLGDLNVTDGWTLVELDEESDEIEFELGDGRRSFDVEVELESDYEVVGPVTVWPGRRAAPRSDRSARGPASPLASRSARSRDPGGLDDEEGEETEEERDGPAFTWQGGQA